MSFHLYFVLLSLFLSRAPPMTLLTAGALTDPQLPATASNVCMTEARPGGVVWVPPPPTQILATPLAGAKYLLQKSHLSGISGPVELLPYFMCARLSASAVISLFHPVFRSCFRAHLHLGRSPATLSQDIVSMSTAFISVTQTSILNNAGLLECDYPPYGGHDPTIAVCAV